MLEDLIKEFAKEKSLTRRETEILFLLVKNITHLKEIAAHLKLSRSTINNHLNNIYIKANVKGKAQLLSQCFNYVEQNWQAVKEAEIVPRVLVVDSNESPRLILRDHLEEIGFKVITTTNPIYVRGLLEKEKIDLILSDMSMPEFEGFKLFKEVRLKCPKYPTFVYNQPYKMMEQP